MENFLRLRLIFFMLIILSVIFAEYYIIGFFLSFLAFDLFLHPMFSLAVVAILDTVLLYFFWEHWPEWYDTIEEDVLHELTLHDEPDIFRISLVSLLFFSVAIGIGMQLRWPFLVGTTILTTTIGLYLVDVVVAMILQGWEGLSDCWDDTRYSSIPGLWGVSSLLFVFSILISLMLYSSLYYTPSAIQTSPLSITSPESEPGLWQKIQQKFNSILQKINSTPNPEPPAPPSHPGQETSPTNSTNPKEKKSAQSVPASDSTQLNQLPPTTQPK